MNYENRWLIRTENGKIDRIKLKSNAPYGNDYYFFGAHNESTHRDLTTALRTEIKKHGLEHKLIYTGTTATIKPFQLARVLETANNHGANTTRRFKDYSGTTVSYVGLDVKNSYKSVLQAYETKYQYYPHYCIIVALGKNKA